MTGHKSLAMLKRYTHVVARELHSSTLESVSPCGLQARNAYTGAAGLCVYRVG